MAATRVAFLGSAIRRRRKSDRTYSVFSNILVAFSNMDTGRPPGLCENLCQDCTAANTSAFVSMFSNIPQINVRDGNFADLGGLDPSLSWESSTKSGDVDIEVR